MGVEHNIVTQACSNRHQPLQAHSGNLLFYGHLPVSACAFVCQRLAHNPLVVG
jgi:hypothetical protein